MSLLDEILLYKRQELKQLQLTRPLQIVQAEAEAAPPPMDFISALRSSQPAPGVQTPLPALIAEVKHASPSKGVLSKDFDPVRLARIYQENGAAAISVLTDERFFMGRLDFLHHIAAMEGRPPLLRKDFILDPYQVFESRAAGADAILLIVACLEENMLAYLHRVAINLGMVPLVEVHNYEELQVALECDPLLIGINNRDLYSFVTSLKTTIELAPLVPQGVLVVSESGIHTREDAACLAEMGIAAVLVGEALVTAPDVAAKVRSFT
jgi:indole-3-glycerol phosphate synthase